jgi:threonine dehydrogenase-like Zn-dependent dehydrogenase
MRIAMIGTGYVGLVSGACFSEFGVDTVCVDKDAPKIERLKAGVIPIYEPGLDVLVAKNAAAGRLSFTTDISEAMKGADAVFIAVGTPSRRGDGHADLSYVYAAAAEIAREMDGYTVVVTKSTVPVGTSREVARIIRETRRCVQPRVFARRLSHRRLHAARSHCHRRRKRARPAGDAPALPPPLFDRNAYRHGGAGDGGADQICRQRFSGDKDHLHQ